MIIATLFIILLLTLVKNSFAVQCNTNPCELGGSFIPPYYNCFQLANNIDNVICTCPNGLGRQNARCRVCDSINCGPNGVCIERPTLQSLFYLCECTNGTGKYTILGPCLGVIPTTTTTTTVATTPRPLDCQNGGVYDPATATCVCRTAFTGVQCERSIGQELCQNITCVNGGICNPVPTASNGVEAQCWCENGYSGTNCELIGISSRCTSNLCQNGGVCEEKTLGSSRFAYCRCSPGFSGQCCENCYFICPYSGLFTDIVNCQFGRYFQCIDTTLIIRSCPIGFRFNSMTMQCDVNVSCPS